MFKGTDSEAAAFSQCMLDYLSKKVLENITQDAAMNDPDVEFSDFSETEEGSTASSATKVKKKYKLKQSEGMPARAKRPKAPEKGPRL